MEKIPFGKPHISGNELAYLQQVLDSASLSGDGTFTRKCQAWLENQLGTPKAMLTHSCTAALEMAAILSGVGPGDEVIMPSFTFVSTANAFVLRGATPVFVDIDPHSLNIDPHEIRAAITPRTRAIVVVHYAGHPCDMDAIQALCQQHGLLLIEDAAQAILTEYKGKKLGTIGDLGCLSFHETKNVISGEGGALLVNNPAFFERADVIWQKGTNRKAFFEGLVDKYTWVDVGSSYLPGELIAAFLYAQLEQAEQINQVRRGHWALYRQLLLPLAQAGYIELAEPLPAAGENAHIFHIMLPDAGQRTCLIQYLAQRAVSAVFHYIPLHSAPAGRQFGRAHGDLPHTDRVASSLLRLPLFPGMSASQVHYVCSQISQFFQCKHDPAPHSS